MRNKMSAESTEVTTSYQPTEQEKGALEAHAGRIRKTLTSPRLKTWVKDNIPQMAVDHPSGGHGQALLMEALATTDTDFMVGILTELGNAGSVGEKVDGRTST
jgi:hypothetical protein